MGRLGTAVVSAAPSVSRSEKGVGQWIDYGLPVSNDPSLSELLEQGLSYILITQKKRLSVGAGGNLAAPRS